ncbi:TetR/AcrR family transcriptional regulator [Zavarzinia compransoris]|uniref:TetR/AcrR family transcriptional regulator n=1 Tax=Zavarzinia marina TaxID=2911065 RepID=UPI001F1D308E|nr:TetR/AcrR family transcriptional regulator [Zavarzinia marina]MCF4165468.1 TetR/AcrR family transcriptional regulator [Zavarzinia marina]
MTDTPSLSPRARKPAQILAAARRLFLAQGYAGTSMDAVAAAAPVSKRTLYQHFPSKEALFGAVVLQVWQGLTAEDAAPRGDEPRQALRDYSHRLMAHWDNPDVIGFLRLIMAEGPSSPEMTAAYYARGKAPAVAALAAYLRPLAAAGRLSTGDAELAAVQFLGMIKEALFWPRVLGVPTGFSPETVVEAAIDRILT